MSQRLPLTYIMERDGITHDDIIAASHDADHPLWRWDNPRIWNTERGPAQGWDGDRPEQNPMIAAIMQEIYNRQREDQ